MVAFLPEKEKNPVWREKQKRAKIRKREHLSLKDNEGPQLWSEVLKEGK